MPLDTVGRQYADKLYQESLEEILKTQSAELVEVNKDFATRNMTMPGAYFTAQAQVYLRNAERLAQARVDSLLRAYEKSEVPLDNAAFQEISAEVAQVCEHHGRNIVQALSDRIGQSLANQAPSGFREAISGQVLSGMSGVSARLIRRLGILRDEAELASRQAAASQPVTQTEHTQSRVGAGNGSSTGTPSAPPREFRHSRPRLYYWRFFLEFGRECYRTWRWELLASLGVSFLTYLIAKSDDPFAWRNFKIAFLATALTLAAFAFWHLIRTPWIVHRSANTGDEPTLHWSFAIFGIAVLFGLIAGGYFSVGYLRAVPLPPVIKIVAPPPPIPPGSAQEKHQKQNKSTFSPSVAQSDRILNAQQSDHLYQKLREFAADPNHADLVSVTIAPYAYQDIESSHLAYQLSRVLEDAHWKVLRQTQLPIKLQGRTQNQIPIGIWILTSRDQNYGYFLWSVLKDVGLDSQVRPQSDIPADFSGTIIWVGYKEAPIY